MSEKLEGGRPVSDLGKLAEMVAAMPEPHRLARSDLSLVLRRLAPALFAVARAAKTCTTTTAEAAHLDDGARLMMLEDTVRALDTKLAEVLGYESVVSDVNRAGVSRVLSEEDLKLKPGQALGIDANGEPTVIDDGTTEGVSR